MTITLASLLPAPSAVALPLVGGFLSSLAMRRGWDEWYWRLKKPSLCPPNWVFAPVWSTLYCAMGFASYLVWRDGDGFSGDARYPLMLYGAHLLLNVAWSPLFFGLRNTALAAVEIVLLTASVYATGFAFRPINEYAFYLFLPYMAWVTFATRLAVSIWYLNRKRSKSP